MYFLYLLVLCYTSILLTPVSTYVVLAGNLNDFRSLAKKYVPKNLVGQIKAMVLENGHKYYKEPLNDDEQVDGAVEYLDDSQQDDSDEVIGEFKTKQQPINRYQVQNAPKAVLAEPSSRLAPLGTPKVLTIDDIVEKVKLRLFQQILDKSVNAQANSLAYKNFPKKSNKITQAKAQLENPIYKPVPMKVIKEEVQFEATYEDTLDKDIMPGQVVQNPVQYLHNKPVSVISNTKNVTPKKNRLNTLYDGGVKKVRFVKQVLVPAHSNQGAPAFVPQSSMVQQQNIVQHSNLEPQLSLMQQPIYPDLHHQANSYQSTIMKQLILMQQQIEQLNRSVQQKGLKNKRPTSTTVVGIPQLNNEALEASFEIAPNPTADEQETNEGIEDQVEPSKEEADESVLSEETTVTSGTETRTKALTAPGAVKNEQFTEENEMGQDSAGIFEIDDDVTQEKTPEEIKDRVLNEEEGIKPDPKSVEGKNNKLAANAKVHTQEFGNPDAGEPIVEKTYNFDEQKVKAGGELVNLKLPVDSARKVMLF